MYNIYMYAHRHPHRKLAIHDDNDDNNGVVVSGCISQQMKMHVQDTPLPSVVHEQTTNKLFMSGMGQHQQRHHQQHHHQQHHHSFHQSSSCHLNRRYVM